MGIGVMSVINFGLLLFSIKMSMVNDHSLNGIRIDTNRLVDRAYDAEIRQQDAALRQVLKATKAINEAKKKAINEGKK